MVMTHKKQLARPPTGPSLFEDNKGDSVISRLAHGYRLLAVGCWPKGSELKANKLRKGGRGPRPLSRLFILRRRTIAGIGDAFVEHILDIFMCPPRSWTRTGPTEEPVISVEFTDSFEHPAKAGEGYSGLNALCWTLFDHFATHFHTLPSPETSPSLVTVDAYMVTPSPAERVPGRSPLLRICRPGTFGVC